MVIALGNAHKRNDISGIAQLKYAKKEKKRKKNGKDANSEKMCSLNTQYVHWFVLVVCCLLMVCEMWNRYMTMTTIFGKIVLLI